MAIEYNPPEWTTGDTETLAFIVADDTGTPLDLTDYTAKMQVRANANGIVLAEGSPTINEDTGLITFTFSATVTANLRGSAPGNLVYDVQTTSGSGVVTTEMYGTIPVRLDITR